MRRAAAGCVALERGDQFRYFRRAGVLTATQEAGRRRRPFTGRFRGKPLRPGSYRARIVAKDAGGLKSKGRVLTFNVVGG